MLKCPQLRDLAPLTYLLTYLLACLLSVILAPALTDALNQSSRESKVLHIWKLANVPPLPKGASIEDLNKEKLRETHILNIYIVSSRGGVDHRPSSQTLDA